MIKLVYGGIGSGKTLYGIHCAKQVSQRGGHVWTNIKLKAELFDAHVHFFDSLEGVPDSIAHESRTKEVKKTVVVVDFADRYLNGSNSSSPGGVPEPLKRLCNMAAGSPVCDLVLVTQIPRVNELHYIADGCAGANYDVDSDLVCISYYGGVDRIHDIRFYASPYFRLYDSTQLIPFNLDF